MGQAEKKPDVILDEKCPQCDHNLVTKQGRFGEFTACSNYPKCRYIKHQTIGVTCPKCGQAKPMPAAQLKEIQIADRVILWNMLHLHGSDLLEAQPPCPAKESRCE